MGMYKFLKNSLVIVIFVKVQETFGMIYYGMAKTVLLKKHFAVLLQAYHGFTETMVAIPLLTILS